jgi:hypothetical protein
MMTSRDGLRVKFDDERAVSGAGVPLVAMLVKRLGIEAIAGQLVRLRRDRPGATNPGRKVMALIFSMVLAANSIDDCEILRAGKTRSRVGHHPFERDKASGLGCDIVAAVGGGEVGGIGDIAVDDVQARRPPDSKWVPGPVSRGLTGQ